MKAAKTKIKVKMSWDKSVSPKRQRSQRGLLIDVEARGGPVTEELPVNLALSIDRSGSMTGGRIAAAKEAARGVVSRLRPEDRLSLVDFDDKVSVLFTGLSMNPVGKASGDRWVVRAWHDQPRGRLVRSGQCRGQCH